MIRGKLKKIVMRAACISLTATLFFGINAITVVGDPQEEKSAETVTETESSVTSNGIILETGYGAGTITETSEGEFEIIPDKGFEIWAVESYAENFVPTRLEPDEETGLYKRVETTKLVRAFFVTKKQKEELSKAGYKWADPKWFYKYGAEALTEKEYEDVYSEVLEHYSGVSTDTKKEMEAIIEGENVEDKNGISLLSEDYQELCILNDETEENKQELKTFSSSEDEIWRNVKNGQTWSGTYPYNAGNNYYSEYYSFKLQGGGSSFPLNNKWAGAWCQEAGDWYPVKGGNWTAKASVTSKTRTKDSQLITITTVKITFNTEATGDQREQNCKGTEEYTYKDVEDLEGYVALNKTAASFDDNQISVTGAIYRLYDDSSLADATKYAFFVSNGTGYLARRFGSTCTWNISKKDGTTKTYDYKDSKNTYFKDVNVTVKDSDKETVLETDGYTTDLVVNDDNNVLYVLVSGTDDDEWKTGDADNLYSKKLCADAGTKYYAKEICGPINGKYDLDGTVFTATVAVNAITYFKDSSGKEPSDTLRFGYIGMNKISFPSDEKKYFCMSGAVYPIYTNSSCTRLYEYKDYYWGYKYFHYDDESSSDHSECRLLLARCSVSGDTSDASSWEAYQSTDENLSPVKWSDGKTYATTLKVLLSETFYSREMKAPSNGHYYLSKEILSATSLTDKTINFKTSDGRDAEDNLGLDAVGVLLTKEANALGKAEDNINVPSMEGAEYRIEYYDVSISETQADKIALSDIDKTKLKRTWLYKTDEKGVLNFEDYENYLVSGDDPYLINGRAGFPLGTVVVYEIKSP